MALTAAGALLALSIFFPYWELNVTVDRTAGLRLVSYLDHLEGPLEEVLVHAGMPRDALLRDLSELERSLGVATTTVICLLVVAATFVRNRWAALLSLPTVAFPLIAVADTRRWLEPVVGGLAEAAGQGASQGFLFGRSSFGPTVIEMWPGLGLWLAISSSIAVVVGLWLHRRAYRPRPGEVIPAAGR